MEGASVAIKKVVVNGIGFSFSSESLGSITRGSAGTYILVHTETIVYKAWVRTTAEGWFVSLLGHKTTFFVQKEKTIAQSKTIIPAKKDTIKPSGDLFLSPLTGRVTKICVLPGDFVEKGQPLLLVESMKMENELCASFSGFIKTILIFVSDVVKQGQVLIEFGKEGAGDATTQDANGEKAVSHS